MGAAREAQQEGVGSGSGAMLDGEFEPVVGTPHQVAGGVGPGMQIGGAAQGLAEIAARTLGHVVVSARRAATPREIAPDPARRTARRTTAP